jgi:predicted dehydrogenase
MGKHHARIHTKMDGVELVGVANANPDNLAPVASRHHTRDFADCRATLDTQKPDLVSLAVPTQWHDPIASNLLES